MTYQNHTALLIDAENTPLAKLTAFLEKWRPFAQGDEEITLKRAYGNWSNPCLKNWDSLLRAHAIRPVQLFNCAAGKNAADISLAVDAMELLHTGQYDTFIIMASDSDYTPLAMKLREAGVRVMGIGKDDASPAYRSACTSFVYLHNIYAEDPDSLAALQNAFGFDEEDDFLEEAEDSTLSEEPELDTSFLFEEDLEATEDAPEEEDPFRGLESPSIPENEENASGSCFDPSEEEFAPGEIGWKSFEDLLEEEFPTEETASPEKVWSELEDALQWESLPTTDENGEVIWDTPTTDLFPPANPVRMNRLHKLLHIAYTCCKDETGFALLSSTGNLMKDLLPALDYRNYGFKQLHELLLAYPDRYQLVKLPNQAMAFRCCT